MHKLKLEDLRVDSFHTQAAPSGATGTVHAHARTRYHEGCGNGTIHTECGSDFCKTQSRCEDENTYDNCKPSYRCGR